MRHVLGRRVNGVANAVGVCNRISVFILSYESCVKSIYSTGYYDNSYVSVIIAQFLTYHAAAV